jgi:hypothetical protein
MPYPELAGAPDSPGALNINVRKRPETDLSMLSENF